MGRQRHTPEKIINKLTEAEVELARGPGDPDVCKKLGTTEQTHSHRRKLTRGGKAAGRVEHMTPRNPIAVSRRAHVSEAAGLHQAARMV